MATQFERYRKWYLKMRADPVRYKALLDRGKKFNAKFRAERHPKYVAHVLRRKLFRVLNPFPHREEVRSYYQRLKADPVAYRAMLTKQRDRHKALMERLRQNPDAFREWSENRKVYKRYFRIIQKEKAA